MSIIDKDDPNCDPLVFPILFPNGEQGWQPYLPKECDGKANSNSCKNSKQAQVKEESDIENEEYTEESDPSQKNRNFVSCREFYQYRLAVRTGFSMIHSAGKLFQQYVVDAYLKIEALALQWYRFNQDKIRVERYGGN